jgi:hypothetical protein
VIRSNVGAAAATGAAIGLEDYLAAISFREVGPRDPAPIRSPVALRTPSKFARMVRESNQFEVRNTLLADGDAKAERLRATLLIPRMSSFAIGAIVNHAVAQLAPEHSYVNVGVWHGFTYFAGLAGNESKTCVAVDNFSEYGQDGAVRVRFLRRFERQRGPRQSFHESDFRDYFRSEHRGKIGVYYYDGDHSLASQLDGLRSAEPFFARDCVVIVDDTNWRDPRQATLQFIAESSNEYTMLLDQQTVHGAHPTFWNGIMVFRRT